MDAKSHIDSLLGETELYRELQIDWFFWSDSAGVAFYGSFINGIRTT